MVAIAPIGTPRLLLRALTDEDLESIFRILGDPVTTAGGSRIYPLATREQAKQYLARRQSQEQDLGFSMWAMQSAETKDLIGVCGFFPHDGDEIELGYVVLASERNQGYATEAASAAITAALEAGFRIYATIRSTNGASLRVAEKLGLRLDGRILDERGTLLVFRRP
jgi:[ribosomal protein S5]-alanine N-acetyltransferase